MNGLVHISKYLNEFKVELDKYDAKLTEKAEEVSNKVKNIQEELSNLNAERFTLWWEEQDEEYTLNIGLHWSGSKVMHIFEDNEPEALLGANRDIRCSVDEKLVPFLEESLKRIKDKTASLGF